MKILDSQMNEFLNACMKAGTFTALVKDASKCFENMGFSDFIFHYIPHLGSKDYNLNKIFHVPKEHREWVLQAFPHFTKVSPRDPFEDFSLRTGQIIWTGDLEDHEEFQSEEKQAFLKAITNRFGSSLLVPAYGPRRSRGYFFLPNKSILKTPTIREAASIEYMCSFFHLTYTKLRPIEGNRLNITRREKDVLQLIPLGLSNREIGLILKISPHTVNGYIKQLFEKLDVEDRISVAQRAFALDLIE